MIDEGYIKFQPHWTEAPPLPLSAISELNRYRQQLYDHKLIGAYPEGIGYGNISCRDSKAGQFIISGTATGNFPTLDERHYALVTRVEAEHNQLWCEGPILASSEAMSHAAIYNHCPEVGAVLHVHHLGLWKRLLHQVPTTNASAPYGSPEMVESITKLLADTPLRQTHLFVMEGHREGIFAFGEDLAAATEALLQYYNHD